MSKLFAFASGLGVLAAGLCFAHAEGPAFDVKPGLWEMTSTSQNHGVPPIPADALAHMTPQQREMMQQHMREAMGRGNEPHVTRHCVTEQKLRDLDFGNDRRECRRTVVSRTARLVEMREECTGREKISGTMHIEAVDREHFRGKLDMQVSNGADSMTVNRSMQGVWLGSNCGDVKD